MRSNLPNLNYVKTVPREGGPGNGGRRCAPGVHTRLVGRQQNARMRRGRAGGCSQVSGGIACAVRFTSKTMNKTAVHGLVVRGRLQSWRGAVATAATIQDWPS